MPSGHEALQEKNTPNCNNEPMLPANGSLSVFIFSFIYSFIHKNPQKRGSEYNKSNKTFVKNSKTRIYDYYCKTNRGNGNTI